MYQNTLEVTASDSTRYHHVQSTMVHWLLCCGALGTSLIIYPACVYLCWTRLCGGGGRERKADRILPACMWGARKSRGTAGFVFACVRVCARASERQKWQQYSYANMSYGLTYTDTDTHTKHLIAKKKKKSLPGSIVSNVFNVNLTLWGHLLLC